MSDGGVRGSVVPSRVRLSAERFGSRRDAKYRVVREIGRGAFGVVEEAVDEEEEVVAIKRVNRSAQFREGMDLGAVMELGALMELQGKGVVRLHEAYSFKDQLVMVMDRAIMDLQHLIRAPDLVLSEADAKAIAYHLLKALQFIHGRGWMHRDLKPENILVLDEGGGLVLADFGHATRVRVVGESGLFPGVVTHWYRSPELLLGGTTHGGAVDVWAAGCIVAEVLLRRPLFAWSDALPRTGKLGERLGQLSEIFRLCGVPSEEDWPGLMSFPGYTSFPPTEPQDFAEVFKVAAPSPHGIDFLKHILVLNPAKRPTAEQALKHPWFTTAPLPTPIAKLPLPKKREAGEGGE